MFGTMRDTLAERLLAVLDAVDAGDQEQAERHMEHARRILDEIGAGAEDRAASARVLGP